VLGALKSSGIRRWLQGWGLDIGPYPPDEATALRAHLSALLLQLDINCVLDVGANTGQFARMVRDMGFNGWIISFEPVSENYSLLRARMSNDAKWQGHQLALGESDGQLSINVTKHSVFSSFFSPNEYSKGRFGGDSDVTNQEAVDVRTLDSLMDSLLKKIDSPRVFLKLDTQGFDLAVLRGARSVLHRICAIQTELSMIPVYEGAPTYREALAFLDEARFRITGFYAINRDQSLRATEFDCVSVRTESG
jgi:FkbM family methyltransferase